MENMSNAACAGAVIIASHIEPRTKPARGSEIVESENIEGLPGALFEKVEVKARVTGRII
jgi:hypothetical protein